MSGDRKSYTGHGPCPYLKPKPKCAKSRALSPVPPSEPAGTAIPVANHDIVDTFWDIPPITFPTDLYDAGGAGAPSGPRPPQSAALTPGIIRDVHVVHCYVPSAELPVQRKRNRAASQYRYMS